MNYTNHSYHIEEQVEYNQPYDIIGQFDGWFVRCYDTTIKLKTYTKMYIT